MVVSAAAVDCIVAVAAVEIVIGIPADDEAVGEVFQELRHRQLEARDVEDDVLGTGERDRSDLAGRREIAMAGRKPRAGKGQSLAGVLAGVKVKVHVVSVLV